MSHPAHRLPVAHNRDTLLGHLSDEDGNGWTVLAVDRPASAAGVVVLLVGGARALGATS